MPLSELPKNASSTDWVIEYGNHRRKENLDDALWNEATTVGLQTALELVPSADDDPAREFLREQGVQWKKGDTVLAWIKRYWTSGSKSKQGVFEEFETSSGALRYLVSKNILRNLKQFRTDCSSESNRKGAITKAAKKAGKEPRIKASPAPPQPIDSKTNNQSQKQHG